MSLHEELPIHKTGCDLLALALKAQEHMPRGMKRHLGDKLSQHSVQMLDLMAMANASRHRARAAYLEELQTQVRAMKALMRASHESRYITRPIWAESIQLLESLGAQCGGWLKKTRQAPAA